jgi:UDP-glucose 4-epimerase
VIKQVVITGAAGFIGRNIACEYAKLGATVIGIGRSAWTDWEQFGLSAWHCCDVTLDSLISYAITPDVIIHCAGGASVGYSVQEPYQDFIQTVETMVQVLEFMRLYSPASRLVYPSSAAVYGQVNSLPISEYTPLQPISPYGVYKKMAEELCQLYANQYHLSIAIVRLFSIYGEDLHKQLLWDACNKLAKGDSEFFGTGEEIRDWLHVSDAAKLIILAAEHASTKSPVLNGGSGEGISVKNILQLLNMQLGFNRQLCFSAHQKQGDPSAYIANIDIAKSWGWVPEIKWQQGVAEYADWYKQCQLFG